VNHLSLRAFLLAASLFLPADLLAGPDDQDGYAIITSRDTILGIHGCYAQCLNDGDCPERQRCVAVPNVGQGCLPTRDDELAPDDWSLCEAPLDCGLEEICARQPAPTKVAAFVEHKRRRGFAVHVVDETAWGGGRGDDGADNIRAWLQANYQALNLRYVLLIGDPRPSGDVPMRGSKPANNAYQDWAGNPVVLTDYYFADLDSNWDLDGDGALAEFSVNPAQIQPGSPASFHPDSLTDDMGPGGANRDAEVSVGRIPFYGNVADLDHILQKTMDYENADEDSIAWRHSALLAAEGQHRAFFGELIRTDVLVPNDFETYRVYDLEACWDHEANEDVDCRSPIDGVPQSLECTPTHVEDAVNAIRPGFVTWLTHGSGRGAQAVMLQGNARALPDDKPFFTFQASCYNGQPQTTDNLAYELLKNGAIGTIGAATISHGPGSPMPSLVNSAGNAGMAYNFAKRLIADRMSAGEALTALRRDVDVNNRWWYWKNYLTFNLWGDPSIGLYSHAIAEVPGPSDMGVDSGSPDGSVAAVDAGEILPDSGVANDALAQDAASDRGGLLPDVNSSSQDAAEENPDSVSTEVDQFSGVSVDGSVVNDHSSHSKSGCNAVSDSSGSVPWLTMLVILLCLPWRRRV